MDPRAPARRKVGPARAAPRRSSPVGRARADARDRSKRSRARVEARRPRPADAVRLLAGDIGGTKTNLALAEVRKGRPVVSRIERFESRDHRGIQAVLDTYLEKHSVRIAAAAFGIAGPVIDGRCEATNLPWIVDERQLRRRLGAPAVLVNDLEAAAHAIPLLGPSQLFVLNKGRPVAQGNLALVAAGTGLGEAFVMRRDGRFLVGATEGGHCDFAPRTAGEIELLRFMMERTDHVSVERVLSGDGLASIYEFLGSTGGWMESSAVRRAIDRAEDRAAAISEAGLDGKSPRAATSLRIFAALFGAEAGNLALKVLATGGVYLAGGIAPKILPVLRGGEFLEAFAGKGRFRRLLRSIPVKVILDEQAPLLGAASIARPLAGGIRS